MSQSGCGGRPSSDGNFIERGLRFAMLRMQRIAGPVQTRLVETQHRARSEQNQAGQQLRLKRSPSAGSARIVWFDLGLRRLPMPAIR